MAAAGGRERDNRLGPVAEPHRQGRGLGEAFPDGHSFAADGDIGAVGREREGDSVTTVQVDSTPMTADDAYQLALQLTRRWGLPKAPIDHWNERRQSSAGIETAEAIPDPGTTVGPGGPEPSLKLLNSFNDDRPVIVSLRFFWS